MSDFDRGKFYGKKKFNSGRGDSKSAYSSRFFNKTVYNPDSPNEEKQTRIKQPQIQIKPREKTEERSISPKRTIVKDETHKENTVNIEVQVTKKMTKSVQLLDEGSICSENIQDFLIDSNEFLVVGVIGPQGAGKSSVMNLLAANRITTSLKNEIFKKNVETDDESIKILTESKSLDELGSEFVFKMNTADDVESCGNTTTGIDVFITENRAILLDCQPFLSTSAFDELMRSEIKRKNMMGDFAPLENAGELQCLQHLAFLMGVCHVLIFVQDFFLDSNNIRFLHTAEMLKPTISNNEEEYAEQFPHLLLLHNRAQMDDFAPNKFKLMQNMYRKMLHGSKMHLESSMGLGTGKIIHSLNPSACGDPINLYLLPEHRDEQETYRGHPPFEDLIERLRVNVGAATKFPITHIPLTEKTWLAYCIKVWEHVKKSSFYVEYTKLMP